MNRAFEAERILDRALTGVIDYERGIALASEWQGVREGKWRRHNV